jgi:5-methylcytosine-specific restriction endonuclease McrA
MGSEAESDQWTAHDVLRFANRFVAGVLWKSTQPVDAPCVDEPPPEKAIKLRAKRRRPLSQSRLFLKSQEWQDLRAVVLQEMGRRCAQCGATEAIQVDHILPRSKFPELALDRANLRPLCWPCNRRKNTKVLESTL